MSAFPATEHAERSRETFAVLHRVDVHWRTGELQLLVQSNVPPRWDLPPRYLTEVPDGLSVVCKPVHEAYAAIAAGGRYVFRLRANPTRKIHPDRESVGPRDNGRRVDLRSDEERLAWLGRKGQDHGFVVVSTLSTVSKTSGWGDRAGGGRRLTFAAVVFDGLLEVRDPDRFRLALRDGIGSAKAFGFGLLSLAKAPA
jgi:CRISPR system Cascade subunit CasE